MKTICTAAAALSLVVASASAAPTGYVVSSDHPDPSLTDRLLRVDLSSGTYSVVGEVGFADVEGLAFDEEGRLFGVDDATNTLIVINTETGAGQTVGGLGLSVGSLDFGLTFDCDGRLLLSSDVARSLYEVDPQTGVATLIANDLGASISGLAANLDGIVGLGVSPVRGTGGEGLFAIDTDGDSVVMRGGNPLNLNPFSDGGLAYDADGVLWGIIDQRDQSVEGLPSPIFRVGVGETAAAIVAYTAIGVESLAIGPPVCERGTIIEPPAPTPIPTQHPLALLGLVLLVLVSVGRRRSLV